MNSQISELIFNIKMEPVFSVTGRHRNLDNNISNDVESIFLYIFAKVHDLVSFNHISLFRFAKQDGSHQPYIVYVMVYNK
jgi:hypothetical protein